MCDKGSNKCGGKSDHAADNERVPCHRVPLRTDSYGEDRFHVSCALYSARTSAEENPTSSRLFEGNNYIICHGRIFLGSVRASCVRACSVWCARVRARVRVRACVVCDVLCSSLYARILLGVCGVRVCVCACVCV